MPIVIVGWILFGLTIGGLLFEYSFEYWASYIKEAPVDIPFWAAMLGGAFFSLPLMPIAVLTFIMSLVL